MFALDCCATASRLLSFLFANTLFGPSDVGSLVGFQICPNLDRSPALGGARGAELVTAQPLERNCASPAPLWRAPPRNILRVGWFAWFCASFAAWMKALRKPTPTLREHCLTWSRIWEIVNARVAL